jgi:hypothetical protein
MLRLPLSLRAKEPNGAKNDFFFKKARLHVGARKTHTLSSQAYPHPRKADQMMLIFLALLLASAELASNCELIFHTANCEQRRVIHSFKVSYSLT